MLRVFGTSTSTQVLPQFEWLDIGLRLNHPVRPFSLSLGLGWLKMASACRNWFQPGLLIVRRVAWCVFACCCVHVSEQGGLDRNGKASWLSGVNFSRARGVAEKRKKLAEATGVLHRRRLKSKPVSSQVRPILSSSSIEVCLLHVHGDKLDLAAQSHKALCLEPMYRGAHIVLNFSQTQWNPPRIPDTRTNSSSPPRTWTRQIRVRNSHESYQPDITPIFRGSRDESETSHQTTEMNAKHKDATLFFALTATISCAAK